MSQQIKLGKQVSDQALIAKIQQFFKSVALQSKISVGLDDVTNAVSQFEFLVFFFVLNAFI